MDSLNRHFTARREDFDRPVLVTGSGGCIGSWALAILVRAPVPAVAFAAAAGREYEVPFSGAVSYLYAGEVASAFVQAVSRDREGAPVFDCVGRSTTVEEGLAALRRLEPDARVSACGDPMPFPFEDRDARLREHIGDYGTISVEEGTAETLRAFRVLLQDGRVSPDS